MQEAILELKMVNQLLGANERGILIISLLSIQRPWGWLFINNYATFLVFSFPFSLFLFLLTHEWSPEKIKPLLIYSLYIFKMLFV